MFTSADGCSSLLRSTRDSDSDDDEDERRVSRGCTLQYQRALVKVLTQFHTTSTEGTDQVITMLGPDWQVDVTDLVQDSLKVADPRIAELVDRTVLVGLELGSTVLKVGRHRRRLLRQIRRNWIGLKKKFEHILESVEASRVNSDTHSRKLPSDLTH